MGIGQTLEGACPLRCEGYWYGNIGWVLACQLVCHLVSNIREAHKTVQYCTENSLLVKSEKMLSKCASEKF